MTDSPNEAMLQAEHDAFLALERLFWVDGKPICPHCGAKKAYFIKPEQGIARRDTRGRLRARRTWNCASCRQQFSVLVGTPLSSTHVPVTVWLRAIDQFVGARLPSARVLAETLGVSPGTAWKMGKVLPGLAQPCIDTSDVTCEEHGWCDVECPWH